MGTIPANGGEVADHPGDRVYVNYVSNPSFLRIYVSIVRAID